MMVFLESHKPKWGWHLAIFLLLNQDCCCIARDMNYNENYNLVDTLLPNDYNDGVRMQQPPRPSYENNLHVPRPSYNEGLPAHRPSYEISLPAPRPSYKIYKRVPGSEFLGKRSFTDINYYSYHAAKRVPGSEFLGKRSVVDTGKKYDEYKSNYNREPLQPKLTEMVYSARSTKK